MDTGLVNKCEKPLNCSREDWPNNEKVCPPPLVEIQRASLSTSDLSYPMIHDWTTFNIHPVKKTKVYAYEVRSGCEQWVTLNVFLGWRVMGRVWGGIRTWRRKERREQFQGWKKMHKEKGKKIKNRLHQDIVLRANFFSENFKYCFVTLCAYWNQAASKQLLHMGAPLAPECQEARLQAHRQRMRSRTGLKLYTKCVCVSL